MRENMKKRHTSPSTHIPEKIQQPRRAGDFSVSKNATVFILKRHRVLVRIEGKGPFFKKVKVYKALSSVSTVLHHLTS